MMMKKLIALAAIGSVMATQADMTLLVNFHNEANGPANVDPTSAANYAVADAGVDLGTAISLVAAANAGNTATGLSGTGFSGVDLTFSRDWAWNTTAGSYANTPIVDSYMYDSVGSLGRTLSVAGIEEVAAGETVTVTAWGVGDGAGSETAFAVTYNGSQSGVLNTSYDTGVLYQQFTFTKVAGVDSFDVNWGKNTAATSGFGGLSVTAIPEPATIGLIGAFGGAMLFIRRRLSM